jgi:mRNA interferase MazF
MFNQKDIVLVPFPYSDLSLSEKRPALIISNDKINRMQDRICCLVTTKIHRDDLLIQKKDMANGSLPFKSSAKPHRVFTIHERIIIKKLCTVTDGFHEQVIKKINEYIKML